VLTASLVAGVLGFGFLWLTTRGPHEATDYEATTADA
jgi:hypothetical protein